MVKLSNILNEVLNIYSVDAVIVSDKDVNFTDILDRIRGTRKITIVNSTTDRNLEIKNRRRNDGKEVHTATVKFIAGKDPKQDLKFLKTTILSSDKGDPGRRIEGITSLVFKEDTLTRI